MEIAILATLVIGLPLVIWLGVKLTSYCSKCRSFQMALTSRDLKDRHPFANGQPRYLITVTKTCRKCGHVSVTTTPSATA